MAMAQDDKFAGQYILRFYEALKAAGYRPEFHIYSSGGHGMAGACANKARRAITGSMSSTTGWKRKG
jgi:dipeptidyl aminopeptidase/acylaminoacyl peptidase